MAIPGFTADLSLYQGVHSVQGYRSVTTGKAVGTRSTTSIIAQSVSDICKQRYASCYATCVVDYMFDVSNDIGTCGCMCRNAWCVCSHTCVPQHCQYG